MTQDDANVFKIRFPGDLDYIPSVRKFVSEILQVSNFSAKFAYRTEIIVDELCNNAVSHGCRSSEAIVELTCTVRPDHVEFQVKDEGGAQEDIERLRRAVDGEARVEPEPAEKAPGSGLGLEIVKMLSEELRLEIDDNDLLSIHVVRKREDSTASHDADGKNV
jgi:anti-sigma regulatory factor (Ser/Thr protein kinase)